MEVMAACRSWILCVGALLASPVRSELSIRGCKDGSVDAFEGTDQLFTCGEYQTIGPQWTVYDEEWRQLYSGSCYSRSCTPWNDQFPLQEVDHEKRYTLYRSTLTIKNITRDSARQVDCSYPWTYASCNLNIITFYIHDCSSGVRDVTEDTDVSFTCGHYTDKVEWSSFDGYDYRTKNYIGHCNGYGCTTLNGSIFFLQKRKISEKKYESTLSIRNLTRHQDFSLLCNEGEIAATCRLRVIAPAIIKDCRVSIRDWQVHATCVVEHMYTSDERYPCRWRVNNAEFTSYFQHPLTVYWFNSRTYRKGVCYDIHTMPNSPGNYTYSIKIDSGFWNTVKTLNIVPPGNPVYTCSEVIQEGSTVSCKCTSSNLGTPPAEFFWNGWNNETLYVKNVQREENGNTHTCSMTWGPNNFISRQAVLILTVVVPVSIVPKTCQVQLSRWKVSGVCTIQWLDTVSDTPNCLWRVSYQSFHRTTPDDFKELISSSISVTVDSVRYKRKKCSFEQKMPVISGNYSYSIRVSSHLDDQFSKSVRIEKPDPPQHNCSKKFLEGSNVTCTCFTSNLGNPPAQIGWAETSKEYFVIEGINRERNGIVITCSLTWGSINYTTPCTILVAWELTYADNPYQGGVIAGSVVAVLLLVVIVAAIILFIKRRKVFNKPKTQTPTVRFAAPSGDIYTIAGTTTGAHREDEYVTVRDTTCPSGILQPQTPVVRFAAPSGDLYSIAGPTTARKVNQETERMQQRLPCHQTKNTTCHKNQGTESEKMPIKPKPTRLGEKSRQPSSSKAEFDNKLDTQRPAAHFASPSGDLYAISGPATAEEDKPVTEATSNISYAPKSSSGHKARDITNMTNKGMDSKKMAIKPKPTRFGKQSRQDVQVTGYMNVTQVPTDSGLGVYHVVPWAAKSETGSSDARVLDTSTISEDEYNVLRFQEDHTGQEDHAVTYNHLNIK